MLCDVLHDAEAPIVFTGAIRPATAPGADGPANLVDAVSVAAATTASRARRARRASAARSTTRARVRKTDTTSPGGVLLAAERPARARHRGPPDDLVAGCRATRRSTRPTSTRASSSSRPPPATTARSRARRSRPSPTAWSSARSAPGTSAPEVLELWGEAARADPGRRLLPPRARRDPQRDLRLRRLRARPARDRR